VTIGLSWPRFAQEVARRGAFGKSRPGHRRGIQRLQGVVRECRRRRRRRVRCSAAAMRYFPCICAISRFALNLVFSISSVIKSPKFQLSVERQLHPICIMKTSTHSKRSPDSGSACQGDKGMVGHGAKSARDRKVSTMHCSSDEARGSKMARATRSAHAGRRETLLCGVLIRSAKSKVPRTLGRRR